MAINFDGTMSSVTTFIKKAYDDSEEFEKLCAYMLSSYPYEMSFRFVGHMVRYHKFKFSIRPSLQLSC